MQKVFDTLDPRKSRRTTSLDPSKIHICYGDNPSFDITQLSQALKSAGSFSGKNNINVTIALPAVDIPIKGALTIPANVTIKGTISDTVDATTRLVLDASSGIASGGDGTALSNLVVVASKKRKAAAKPEVSVPNNTSLTITECVFQTDGIISPMEVFGSINIVGSSFSNWSVYLGVTAVANVSSTSFIDEIDAPDSLGVQILSKSKAVSFSDCQIRNYSTAILVKEAESVTLSKTTLECRENGLLVQSGDVTGDEISSSATVGINAAGSRSAVQLRNSKIINSATGVLSDSGAHVYIADSTIIDSLTVGAKVSNVAFLELRNTELTNQSDDKINGLEIMTGGFCQMIKSTIVGFAGVGVSLKNNNSKLNFNEIHINRNKSGGIKVSDGANLTGKGAKFQENLGDNIFVTGATTKVSISVLQLKGGASGITVNNSFDSEFTSLKAEAMTDHAVLLVDAVVKMTTAQINQTETGTDGIKVVVNDTLPRGPGVLLQDCKFQGCAVGINILQTIRSDPGSLNMPRCDIENAAFVKCDVGCKIDTARAALKGCSFIMNKTYSIILLNQPLRSGGAGTRKEANVKVRWANFVEPFIENGDHVSNNHQLLTLMTKEKSFYGSADFEPIMYINTLTERIRQARNLFRSKESGSIPKARVIMRSVSHMLILLRQLPPRLLDKQLNDDPDLGMFAATFKLYEDKDTPTNTLVTMRDLFASWKDLHRTRLFDAALQALDEAFQRKQLTEDLYDEWVTPLEEMQRVCFVRSKFNRRRDYLLTTAKETPLTTWYFLDKESPDTSEGKKLREEVLLFLAADRDENRVHNKTNFHASWVAQWAVKYMGDYFLTSKIPDDVSLRRAWADNLLDAKKPMVVFEAYEKASFSTHEIDDLIKFECLKLHETLGTRLTAAQFAKLGTFYGGKGFNGAMQAAAGFFHGEGALPGFLRRVVEEYPDMESLLEPLSFVSDATGMDKRAKDRVILACLSHKIHPDSQNPPEIYRQSGGSTYETCQMCWVQKLQPWNELKLEACKHNHRFCRPCMRQSMSTGEQQLWGICPGDVDGEPCTALATRREMELAGMERGLVFNILSKRVSDRLRAIKGWKACDAPGCLGGRSGVTKDFYSCRLCNKMVTADGGLSDPTVPRRLLQGLDGTAITRGEGVFRECYWCSVTYEKGNACSTITCSNCQKQFSMTWGPEKITHRFDEEGVGPQRYVPKEKGKLWELGVFKDKKGKPLTPGQVLTEAEAAEVVRRAKMKLVEYQD